MRKFLLGGAFLVFIGCQTGFGQVGSQCAQTLRTARSTYEQGRLHEVPGQLEDCLKKGDQGFSKSERVEAYKLLALSYIYLEEPENADQAMLGLLNTDHFFTINDQVDPAEFIALYKKFRTKSLFRIGIKLGANMTQATPLKDYYVADAAVGNGSYKMRSGFQAGFVFEKDILKNKFTFAPELFYVTRSYSYSNQYYFTNDSLAGKPNNGSATATNTYNQSWVDLNAIIHYKLKATELFTMYVGGGPGAGYLLSAKGTNQTNGDNGKFVVTGADVDYTKSYHPISYSFTLVAGMKYRIGGVYVIGDIRYQYGLSNVVDPAHRTNPESVWDYGTQLNDTRQSNVMVNIGFLYPYFKPKKLIR